jgi:hypothetical protein
MEKYNLVMSLLESGKIDKDQALLLLNPNSEVSESLNDKLQAPGKTLEDIVKCVLDNKFFNEMLYSDDFTSVEDIVNFMGEKNWRWCGKEVSNSDFEQHVIDLTDAAMRELLKQHETGAYIWGDDIIGFASTGGIYVECKLNFNKESEKYSDIIDVNVKFIAQEWFGKVNINDFK